MKNHHLLLVILCLFITSSGAQSLADTIVLHPKKATSFKYHDENVSAPQKLRPIVLKAPIDPIIKTHWNEYNSLHPIGIGLEVGGAVMMGVNLVQTLQGNESQTLTLAGALTMLLGQGFDAFVARPALRKAVLRYNDVKLGRNLQAYAPTKADLVDNKSGTLKSGRAPFTPPVKTQKDTTPRNKYLSLSLGTGWSKQQANYEEYFDGGFQSASTSSFGLNYGKFLSEKMGYQLGIGITTHGYGTMESAYNSGVNINVKADARIRYLEFPVSLAYYFPIGQKNIQLVAMPGLNIGYALSGKVVAHGKGENEGRSVRTIVSEKVPIQGLAFTDRFDAAFLLGTQVTYPWQGGKLFAEARYHFGLLNLDRSGNDPDAEEKSKAYNRTLLLQLGYRYFLK